MTIKVTYDGNTTETYTDCSAYTIELGVVTFTGKLTPPGTTKTYTDCSAYTIESGVVTFTGKLTPPGTTSTTWTLNWNKIRKIESYTPPSEGG